MLHALVGCQQILAKRALRERYEDSSEYWGSVKTPHPRPQSHTPTKGAVDLDPAH